MSQTSTKAAPRWTQQGFNAGSPPTGWTPVAPAGTAAPDGSGGYRAAGYTATPGRGFKVLNAANGGTVVCLMQDGSIMVVDNCVAGSYYGGMIQAVLSSVTNYGPGGSGSTYSTSAALVDVAL